MPKIACPKCRKVYELPESADGRVATCKCGAKFRVRTKPKSPAPTPAAATTSRKPVGSTTTVAMPAQPKRPNKPAPVDDPFGDLPPMGGPLGGDDDFWDSSLPEEATTAAADPLASAAEEAEAEEPAAGKKKKRSSGGGVSALKGSVVRISKIVGGAAIFAGSCWYIYWVFQNGGRFRVKSLWIPIAGLGIMASGIFGSSE